MKGVKPRLCPRGENAMKRNMYQWLEEIRHNPIKRTMPVLSYPGIQLLGITVRELISSSDYQARGMKAVADRTPDALASVSLMDLSVEAECFGSQIVVSDDEVPTVTGRIVECEEDVEALAVPKVYTGRTGIYIEAIEKALTLIEDRPVFAGVIGPFSLAGRLVDVTEAMIYCYEEPEMLHKLLGKVTDFLIAYIAEYKKVGANGVVIAEPLAGLLSPDLAEEFSSPYVKRIVDALQDENFLIIYHNCGGGVVRMIDSILATGCKCYHFGNAIDMREMMPHIPADIVAMGNIDPAGQFRNGTPASIAAETRKLMDDLCPIYPNFAISSGCDIPPLASWDNIDAYFAAVRSYNENK